MADVPSVKPITQEKPDFRAGLPEWVKQLPRLQFPPPDPNFSIIEPAQLAELLKGYNISDATIQRLVREVSDIDHDVMRLFRQRDYEASQQQNRYRLYQMGYMALATAATFFGSLQALAFGTEPRLVAAFALIQTIIAGFSTFLSFISTREPPLPRWMDNRRKAEFMRREYYRYLLNLPPYRLIDEGGKQRPRYEIKGDLAERVARANQGKYPEEVYVEQ